MSFLLHIDGFSSEEAESLILISAETGLSIKDIMFAGILISSLGAIMDVAMSITSSLFEIRTHKPDITTKELFHSGLEIGKDIDKTIVKTINPETLETTSILAEIDEYITSAIYNEKTNSIYWESSNGTSEDYVMEYNFDSKEVSVSNSSLPYIEALFSIKY